MLVFYKRNKRNISFFLLLCVMAGGYYGYLQISGNFHTVVPGALYRSAQITPGQISRYKERYGIRTIINLRGDSAGNDWYEKEVAAAQQLGIQHVDFGMSANKTLSIAQAGELVKLLKAVPKPVLIHCKAGSDRSGLVAAIYLAAVDGSNEGRAEREISICYGHIGIPYISSAYAMDETWENLEPWLGFGES